MWKYTTGGDWFGNFETQEEAENYCIDVLGLEIGAFETGQKGVEF